MKKSPATLAAIAAIAAVIALLPATASANEAMEVCGQCHGAQGISAAGYIPNLAGQKQAYLEAQLVAFQQGKRSHDIMGPIARQLSAAQRTRLATYFSLLPAASASAPAQASGAATVRRFAASPFPAGFPEDFRVYQDVREGNSRKLVWANLSALNAAQAGRPLPDGSAIVVENRKVDAQSAEKSARPGESRETVTSFAVMQSGEGWGDEVPELLRNGNWRYGTFDGERNPRDKAALSECLACHKAKVADHYVFSLADLRTAAEALTRRRP